MLNRVKNKSCFSPCVITCVQTFWSPSTVAANSCSGYTFFYYSQLLCCLGAPFMLYSFYFLLPYNILRNKIKIRPTLGTGVTPTPVLEVTLQPCMTLTDQRLTRWPRSPCVSVCVCVCMYKRIHTPIHVREARLAAAVHRSKVSPAWLSEPQDVVQTSKTRKKKSVSQDATLHPEQEVSSSRWIIQRRWPRPPSVWIRCRSMVQMWDLLSSYTARVAQAHIYWKVICTSCSFFLFTNFIYLWIYWGLSRNKTVQPRLFVTDAIWNWPINASNFCGIYMYILGLLCISCINNSCFYDSLTSDIFLFFFVFLHGSRWLCCPTLLTFLSRWRVTKSSHRAL